ncbi:hypothetical protein ACH4F6_37945 [Streptomyces sp. NPDC017936]|uniref:hypothetical protein n=1 Tax=Streptomyces sp. NPDC017936 TaxID=3365016 RepID=UPI0037A29A02
MSDRPPVPEGWEFRLSHDRRLFAFYDPGNGPWFVPEPAMRGRFVDSADMDALGWYRYVPEPDNSPVSLHLTVQRPEPGEWHGRLDVAEALEADGWTGDDDGHLLRKNGAVWAVTSPNDDSGLTCPNGAVLDFPRDTPAVVIIAACLAAAHPAD